jgi:AcrR family transcriptional regulator
MSRRDEVLAAAEALVEAEGAGALTMRRLGAALGMQAPSLYKHVGGKDDIEAALQERALRGLAAALVAGGDLPGPVARGDLPGLARAYRGWALAHPRLYELALGRPPLPAAAGAASRLVAAMGADEHTARALWALAHGLVTLELAGRFPPGADLDATWREALARFARPTCPTPPGGIRSA